MGSGVDGFKLAPRKRRAPQARTPHKKRLADRPPKKSNKCSTRNWGIVSRGTWQNHGANHRRPGIVRDKKKRLLYSAAI